MWAARNAEAGSRRKNQARLHSLVLSNMGVSGDLCSRIPRYQGYITNTATTRLLPRRGSRSAHLLTAGRPVINNFIKHAT